MTDAEIAELDELIHSRRRELGIPEPAPAIPVVTAATAAIARQKTPEQIRRIEQEDEARRVYFEKNDELRRKESRRSSEWYRYAGARGERYTECRLGNYEITTDQQRAEVERLTDYAENIHDRLRECVNLFFIGPSGTGKDHLMAAMCFAAIAEFRTLEWRNGVALWAEFRSTISSERDELELIHKLAAPDVLAISDPLPPRGPLTDYQASNLLAIVDERYSRNRPTWVTVNAASRQEAEERMGSQVVDRLAHDAIVLRCNWKSYRRGK